MRIQVHSDADTAATAGAKFIAAKAHEAVAARGRFVMAVSGGRVPWQMFRILARETMPWKDVHITQVDERVAPAGDQDRNQIGRASCRERVEISVVARAFKNTTR